MYDACMNELEWWSRLSIAQKILSATAQLYSAAAEASLDMGP